MKTLLFIASVAMLTQLPQNAEQRSRLEADCRQLVYQTDKILVPYHSAYTKVCWQTLGESEVCADITEEQKRLGIRK